MGGNLNYTKEHLEHLGELFEPDAATAVRDSDLVVVGKRIPALESLSEYIPNGVTILDLTRQLEAADFPRSVVHLDDLRS